MSKAPPNRIAELRAARGWSLELLGERCSPPATASQISKLEKGTPELTLSWMRRVGAALDVAPSALLGDADMEFRASEDERALLGDLRAFPGGYGTRLLKSLRIWTGDMLKAARGGALPSVHLEPAIAQQIEELFAGRSTGEQESLLEVLRSARRLAEPTATFRR